MDIYNFTKDQNLSNNIYCKMSILKSKKVLLRKSVKLEKYFRRRKTFLQNAIKIFISSLSDFVYKINDKTGLLYVKFFD